MHRYNPADTCDSGIRFHDGFCSPRGELDYYPGDEWARGCRAKVAAAVGRDPGHFSVEELSEEIGGCGESSVRKIVKQMEKMKAVEGWWEMRGLDKTGRRLYELRAPGMDLSDWVAYRQQGGLSQWDDVDPGGDIEFDPASFGAPEEVDLADWSQRPVDDLLSMVSYEVIQSENPDWQPSLIIARHPDENYPIGIAEVYHSANAVWDERAFSGLGPDQYAPLGCVRVHPGYRRIGVATVLIQQAAALAAGLGIPLASSDARIPEMAKFWKKQVAAKRAKKKRHRSKKHPEAARYMLGYPPPESLANPRWNVRSVRQGLNAIQHADITKNYRAALRFKPKHRVAVLIPCAQTKPFSSAPSHSGGYLAALEGKAADVWVVAEPLGVVPYAWNEKYPNADYDFPPRYLTGEAFDVLAGRVAQWLKSVGPKYDKVVLALPAHHMRLVEAALDQLGYAPTSLSYAGIGDCLDAGSCPPGHYRPTSKSYKKYLRKRVRRNPPDDLSDPGFAAVILAGDLLAGDVSPEEAEARYPAIAAAAQAAGDKFSLQEVGELLGYIESAKMFRAVMAQAQGARNLHLRSLRPRAVIAEVMIHPAVRPDAPPGSWQTTEFGPNSSDDPSLVPYGHSYQPSLEAALTKAWKESGPMEIASQANPYLRNPYQEWWRSITPGVEGEGRSNPCWPCLLL